MATMRPGSGVDLQVDGTISATNIIVPSGAVDNNSVVSGSLERDRFAQEQLKPFALPWESWRVWDAYQTNLPGTSANDDLGLYGGTFGTNSPSIQSYDVKAVGATTLYARTSFVLPPEYDSGETVQARFFAGMDANAADTSATLDLQVYECDKDAGIGSDLCDTSAIDINSTTLANRDFTINAAGLVPGDILDMRIAVAINDGAGASPVAAIIGAAWMLLDIRG